MHFMVRAARRKYIGRQFGRLLVVDYIPGNKDQGLRPRVECKCNCGQVVSIRLDGLRDAGNAKCTCTHGKHIGKRFGRLVITAYEKGIWTSNTLIEHARATCICDCGKIITVSMPALASGKQVSCGCWNQERRTTHEMSKTPEYRSWLHMKQRCLNPETDAYIRYGGAGVTICERWLNSFENFLEDMGLMPDVGYTIGRKNHKGNYGPDNCEWQTRYTQARQKSSNIFITFDNRTQCLTDWATEKGLNPQTLKNRLDRGDGIGNALNLPLHRGVRI